MIPKPTREQRQLMFGTNRKFMYVMCVLLRALAICIYESKWCHGHCATVCISEEVGFQQSRREYLFVCGCAGVEQQELGGGAGDVEAWILITRRSMVLWRWVEMDGV